MNEKILLKSNYLYFIINTDENDTELNNARQTGMGCVNFVTESDLCNFIVLV